MSPTIIEKKAATLASLVKDYANYNLWANKTLIDWLSTKEPALMSKEVPSSFPTIKQTLFHILVVQEWWLGNLKKAPVESRYRQVFEGPVEQIFRELIDQSEILAEHIGSLSQFELNEDYAFSIPTVGNFSSVGFEIVHHLMNHGTYHRGQVITIAHQLGLHNAPMTDYMFYVQRVK